MSSSIQLHFFAAVGWGLIKVFWVVFFVFLNDGYEEKNIKRCSLEAKNVFFLLSSHYSTWKEVSDAEYDHKVAIQP